MVWCGVVWCGVVWCGVVLVWYHTSPIPVQYYTYYSTRVHVHGNSTVVTQCRNYYHQKHRCIQGFGGSMKMKQVVASSSSTVVEITQTTSTEGSRTLRGRNNNSLSNKLVCSGTNRTMFGIRILTVFPMVIFVIIMILVAPSTKTSLAIETIKTPLQLTSFALLFFSRLLVYIHKNQVPEFRWNCLEIAEGIFPLGGALIVAALLSVPLGDDPRSWPWANWLVLLFYEGLLFLIFHPLIKQIMLAQKSATSGYALELGQKFLIATVLNLFLSVYGISILGTNGYTSSLPISKHANNLRPIILSSNYNCSDKQSFLSYLNQFPIFRDNSDAVGSEYIERGGCPYSSGGINTTSNQWCGFSTWEESCYRLGIIPAMFAVKWDTVYISCFIWSLVFCDMILFGRGTIKLNRNRAFDNASIKFLTRPRMLYAIFCMFILTIFIVYCVSDIMLHGNFLKSPSPLPPPLHPSTLLPGVCYGNCINQLRYFIYAIGISAFTAAFFEVVQTCKCCGYTCIDNTRTNDRLYLGAQTVDDLLNTNQKAYLMEHLKAMVLSNKMKDSIRGNKVADVQRNVSSNEKFVGTKPLITGELTHTTEGLQSFLCIDDVNMKEIMSNPEQAIIDEVKQLGNKEVTKMLQYIREEPVSEKVCPNGVRDKGRPPGMTLVQFMEHENVQKSSLKREHVIALRLYTTTAYKFINGPLRDIKRKENHQQHPLAACVIFIQDGIKKLRNVIAEKNEENRYKTISNDDTVILWRGMKNVHATNEFVQRGGTELAPMSTTTDFKVAVKYGTCREGSLLLKIVVPSALNHGADLAWLSCFPTEKEVLYPPLTFLRSRKRFQTFVCEENGAQVNILEVDPDLSAGV